MIKLELYPLEDTPPRIGTVYHSRDGVAVAMRQEYKCKADIRRYLCGLEPANYPVPTCIGEVIHLSDDCCYEVIIEDCDETNDPRLHIVVSKLSGRVFDDYPHDSPNYR